MLLRRIRITAAALCFVFISLLFLDLTGISHRYLGWLARLQLIPAILALNGVVIIGILAVTLLLGRVYCSVICPLGVFQDIFSWYAGKWMKRRFAYSPARNLIRFLFLAVFSSSIVLGLSSVFVLYEPYSVYGRIISNLFTLPFKLLNNFAALLADHLDSYAVYSSDIWIKSSVTLFVAAVSFLVIAVLAWRKGRIYCNTLCPVGTVLGIFSRFSFFKPVVDPDKCNRCGMCSGNCKASCIDHENHAIDASRCVMCMDCICVCSRKAISFIPHYRKKRTETPAVTHLSDKKKNTGRSTRSAFLSIISMFAFAASARAASQKIEGGLAVLKDRKIPDRKAPLSPAGSQGGDHLSKHCTSCGLCITACPNQVLRPHPGISRLMQPEMSYERGYCRPECTECSRVCPTGAIRPISKADKSVTQIGHAVWIRKNCVVLTDHVSCGNCARHCPAGAIHMVPTDFNNPDSPQIPAVDTEHCIGCGACEYLCPSRPFPAIYVEGHERHKIV
jgi:polyferredoxin